MVNNISIIAYEDTTARLYKDQLKNLFKNYVNIQCYCVNKIPISKIKTDVVLVSTHAIYEFAKKYVDKSENIIVADLTFKKSAIEKLNNVPKGSKAMLVNSSLNMAVETIGLIYNSGIRDIDFFPVYPGIKEIPKCKLAVTPGEINKVPVGINKIINLEDRVLSMITISNIATKLSLKYLLSRIEFKKYFNTLIPSDVAIDELVSEVNRIEKYLELVLQIFNDGVIGIDRNGYINFVNKSCEDILNMNKSRVMGLDIRKLLSDINIDQVMSAKESVLDKVIEYRKQILIMSIYPINSYRMNLSNIIFIKKYSDEANKQNRIRKQITSKGHIAKYSFNDIIGNSKIISDLKVKAIKMSKSNSSILIYGASGTGKELFAQSIHTSSERKDKPFIAINCASIPDNLLESELFGYEEGAFSGAKKGGKVGYFELAHTGTLFLDEISELSLNLQSRLLRVLQERELVRVGGNTVIKIDVRIISATNKNLKTLIRENKFKQDLYYRLNVLNLNIPRLRERKEDIPLLIEEFKKELDVDFEIPANIMNIIINKKWEGNIRELRNFVERLVYNGHKIIEIQDISECLDLDEESSENSGFRFYDSEESILFESFINENRKDLYKYYNILEILSENVNKGLKLGRRSIYEILKNKDINISEQQVRSILSKLEAYNIVMIKRGRAGTKLTTFGMRVYQNIITKYVKYIR